MEKFVRLKPDPVTCSIFVCTLEIKLICDSIAGVRCGDVRGPPVGKGAGRRGSGVQSHPRSGQDPEAVAEGACGGEIIDEFYFVLELRAQHHHSTLKRCIISDSQRVRKRMLVNHLLKDFN